MTIFDQEQLQRRVGLLERRLLMAVWGVVMGPITVLIVVIAIAVAQTGKKKEPEHGLMGGNVEMFSKEDLTRRVEQIGHEEWEKALAKHSSEIAEVVVDAVWKNLQTEILPCVQARKMCLIDASGQKRIMIGMDGETASLVMASSDGRPRIGILGRADGGNITVCDKAGELAVALSGIHMPNLSVFGRSGVTIVTQDGLSTTDTNGRVRRP